MSNKNISKVIFVFLLFVSCSKSFDNSNVVFDALTINNAKQPTTTFKAGDTVNFIFTGNPDQITFFSGEKGRRYAFKDKVSDTSSDVKLYFSTILNTAGASGAVSLLISTDYKGYIQNNALDSIAVSQSNWQDISSRAFFATNATSTASGAVNLADYAVAKKPIHIAFKYTAVATVTQSRWTISNIGLRHKTADSTFTIDSTALILPSLFPTWAISPGWGAINVKNPLVRYSPNVSTSTTTFFGITGSTIAANALSTENWLVSGPIDLSRVFPDAGRIVKDITTNASTSNYSSSNANSPLFANYAYRFMRPGTYTISFLAVNSNRDSQNTFVKDIIVTVQ